MGPVRNTLEAKLREEWIPGESFQLYAILDGASVPDLRMQFFKLEPEHHCLFEGDLEDDMKEVAPYLVSLEPEHPFTNWILERGWGQHWGVFFLSSADFLTLLKHLRKFIIVHDETGKPLRFRYYDPRVLPTFLPTCTKEEIHKFFGPVQRFLAESEDPTKILAFESKNGDLKKQELTL